MSLALRAAAAASLLSLTLCAQQACEKLAELKFTNVTLAAEASAERCTVKGVARPGSDSEIRFELWLPVSNWNGKYLQSGNGGWAGAIPAQGMAEPFRRGYAVAGTDNGHGGGGGSADWAIGRPEKLIDFGWRSLHVTAVHAKAIIAAYYGKASGRNYFMGCSDGGREALMEAQRFPDDFEGIIAGAPANNWSRLFTGFVWNEQALLADPAATITPAHLPAIQAAALAACDALDGLSDGLIEDPRACRFNPEVLLCKGPAGPGCLTAPQLAALRKIYAGPTNPRTGEQLFPGYPPGTEAIPTGWNPWIISPQPPRAYQFAFGNSYYGAAVFETPGWDFRKLNFDADVAFGDLKAGSVLNSTNPDLRSFRARGGRLMQYHGWGDAAIAPQSSIDYYEQVRAFLARFPDGRSDASRPVQDFYRLFMAPGLSHCGGGIGATNFGQFGAPARVDADHDILSALERWVEQGVAPARIIATGRAPLNAAQAMTRPLCAYPQVARYNGTGDPNDAASFSCQAR